MTLEISEPRGGGSHDARSQLNDENPPVGSSSFSYVLPLAAREPVVDPEFDAYLATIGAKCELIVVDGSPANAFEVNHRRWSKHLHVSVRTPTPMGKVGNVLTGVSLATHDRIVIADDDVRFGSELFDLVERLDSADVVRPQNYFAPLPWHAVWDSGRSLINRAAAGDWPGTLAIRRSVLVGAGGYAGNVMFENFELVKTIEAAGGRQLVASDLFVRRLPPTTHHFVNQRIRQAYDDLARPVRFVSFLAVIPTLSQFALRRRWVVLVRAVCIGAVTTTVLAEVGRRRDGATSYFPLRCSLVAPLWALERSVCVWPALFARLRGGIRYRYIRISRAALSARERHQAVASMPAHQLTCKSGVWQALRRVQPGHAKASGRI